MTSWRCSPKQPEEARRFRFILTEMPINISIAMEPLQVTMLSACALLWAVSDGLTQVAQSVPPVARVSGNTFTNPLLESGPDPWVIWWKGFYYYTDTSSKNLTLRKTADITDLGNAENEGSVGAGAGTALVERLMGARAASLGR